MFCRDNLHKQLERDEEIEQIMDYDQHLLEDYKHQQTVFSPMIPKFDRFDDKSHSKNY